MSPPSPGSPSSPMVSSEVSVTPTPDPPDELDQFPPLSLASPQTAKSSIPPSIPEIEAPSYAQRFKNSLRNLRKITSPTSVENGIPVVIAPASVVLQASKSWEDHIIAHFHGRCPVPSRIFNDLNPVWGKHGNITIHALSQSACLILIPSEATRQWVLDVGYWQVDNCALTAVPWSADASLEMQELINAPTWAILKQVPPQLYSLDGISVIASGIGEPLHTEHSRLEPFHFGDTKVKVEIKLEHLPPLAVIVRDTQGFSVKVEVVYPRLPPKCCNCGKFGHSLKYCPYPIQRKNFKLHQVGPRVTSSPTQVTIVDKDLHPEGYISSEVAEMVQGEGNIMPPDSEETDVALEDGELVTVEQGFSTSGAQKKVKPSLTIREEDVRESSPAGGVVKGIGSNQPMRATGFPPFTGKPSLRFLSHRLDKTRKLRLTQTFQKLPPVPEDTSVIGSEEGYEEMSVVHGIELEEGEIPFLPSPAAVKKAKKAMRMEAKHANSPPSQAVSQMFSSIRDKSLGRKPRRY